MRNLILFLILLLGTLSAKAQGDKFEGITEESLEGEERLNKGTVIKRRDSETGLFLADYETSEDENRISFLAFGNSDFASFTDLGTFEFIYAKRFDPAWVEVFVSRTSAKFSEFTEINTSIAADSDELRGSDDSILAAGVGLSYRTRWIQNLIRDEKLFSTTSASLGYYQLSQTFLSQDYAGPGLKADFGIHKRSSSGMHWGGKMSYNLAHVKKKQEFQGESSSSRSLLLTWLSFGLDISFYF